MPSQKPPSRRSDGRSPRCPPGGGEREGGAIAPERRFGAGRKQTAPLSRAARAVPTEARRCEHARSPPPLPERARRSAARRARAKRASAFPSERSERLDSKRRDAFRHRALCASQTDQGLRSPHSHDTPVMAALSSSGFGCPINRTHPAQQRDARPGGARASRRSVGGRLSYT